MQVAERDPAETPVPDAGRAARPPARPLVALLLALVAVLSAALLPLAPVEMSAPTVSWPQDPAGPTSTMLELNNQTPRSLDVEVSCAAVRAAGTDGGVVVSTMVPDHPSAPLEALLVTTAGDRLTVLDRGRTVLDEPLPAGDCRYALTVTPDRVTVERDGARVAELLATPEAGVLPAVEVLTTDVARLADPADLRVQVRVDDQFNTTPAPLKKVLVVVLLLSAAGSLVALYRLGRGRAGEQREEPGDGQVPRARGPLRLLVLAVDVAVVATMVLWLFIAPMSDDDGYYAAMARNSGVEGFVGNYYQLLNQSFTPFTWFYRVLGWWTQVGDSAVVLRVPALVVGLLTWLLVRRYVTRPGALPAGVGAGGWGRVGTIVLLAAAFLGWWLPYGMGVRPEAVVAALAMATLAAVTAGLRRGALFPVGVGFGLAGLAVACHPTGLVALGPLLVALPRLVPLLTAGGDRLLTATRTALVLAPGAFPVAAAFADGSLNDFRRGQEIFLSFQAQTGWYDEWQRYTFLLSAGPMGSYAKRAAVLLAIVALAWFLVLAVTARTRGVALPLALRMAGLSLGAAFLLLWITPSKWTHHFGALAGLGPVFLALLLAGLPALVRQVTADRRPGWPVPLAVLASVVVVAALAFRGPNQWAYTWLPGVPQANVAPSVGPVALGSLVPWALLAVLVVGALVLVRRRRRGPAQPWLVAVPVLAVLFLCSSVGVLVGSFALATVRTTDSFSPWAEALTDPLARDCGAAGAVRVSDLGAATPAAVAVPAPAPTGPFTAGAGWVGVNPPPGTPGQGVTRDVWGSLSAPGGEDLTGEMTSSWYTLPEVGADEQLTVLAAGRLGLGNRLVAEFGRATGAGDPVVVHSQPLTDAADSPSWRTFVLDVGAARQAGATVVRLAAADVSGGIGGWLAFTGPAVTPVVPLTDLLADDEPVGVAWQLAFLFPCQQQPTIRFGITEPVRYGVLWVDNPATSGVFDATWQPGRGLFGPVHRTASMTQLVTTVAGAPGVQSVQVQRFGLPYPVAAYDLRVDREQRWGWQGP